jgi:hypothetical protein
MDTSLEYVKMCERATEIQSVRPRGKEFEDGDFVGWLHGTESGYRVSYPAQDFPDERGSGDIWLPRQDQLQEVVIDKIDCPSHSAFAIIINLGSRFLRMAQDTATFDYWIQFLSMEQLWLAFVMHEKYNKKWNGQEWANGPAPLAHLC